MMVNKFTQLILSLAVAVALTACWNLGSSKRSNQFEDTIDAFRLLIRWGEFEKALNFIKLREGERPDFESDFYRNIRVTRYEIIDKIGFGMDLEDPREIHIITAIDYNRADDIAVKTIRYQQVWWYDETAERWFLDGDLPDFRIQLH